VGFLFKKSIKIAPGIRLNIGKKSVGISAGIKGARISANTKGQTNASVGVPGTGISFRKRLNSKESKAPAKQKPTPPAFVYCNNCGVKLQQGSNFCHKCGKKM